MSETISPEEAAQLAEQPAEAGAGAEPAIPEGAEAHMGAEGIEASPSRAEQLLDSMWNTTPNPPLEAVESPWNPEKGGMTRVFRGVQKLADVDGLPAVVDILVGLAEFQVQQRQNSAQNSDGTDIESLESEQPVDGVDE